MQVTRLTVERYKRKHYELIAKRLAQTRQDTHDTVSATTSVTPVATAPTDDIGA